MKMSMTEMVGFLGASSLLITCTAFLAVALGAAIISDINSERCATACTALDKDADYHGFQCICQPLIDGEEIPKDNK